MEKNIDELIALEASGELSKGRLRKVRQKIIDLIVKEEILGSLAKRKTGEAAGILANHIHELSPGEIKKLNREIKSCPKYSGTRMNSITSSGWKTGATMSPGLGVSGHFRK